MNSTSHPKGELSPCWKGGRRAAQKRCDYKRREQQRARSQARYQQHKLEAILYYSNGIPKCARCGEQDIDVLCIDHINGKGKQHWEQRKREGELLFMADWLKQNNYPEGYQVLCYNCNHRKTIENQEMRKYKIEENK